MDHGATPLSASVTILAKSPRPACELDVDLYPRPRPRPRLTPLLCSYQNVAFRNAENKYEKVSTIRKSASKGKGKQREEPEFEDPL